MDGSGAFRRLNETMTTILLPVPPLLTGHAWPGIPVFPLVPQPRFSYSSIGRGRWPRGGW